jgi:hypothetical protein
VKENSFQLHPPVISSVSPLIGSVNQVVTISGMHFSPSHSKVFLHGLPAKIIQASFTEIVCQIPQIQISGNVALIIETGQGNLKAEAQFEYRKPSLTSISPLSASFGDEITIYGEYFSDAPDFNVVKFGSTVAVIQSVTSNEIKILVPNTLSTPTHEISLTYGSEKIVYTTPFKLKPPEILDVIPNKVELGHVVVISGSNFSPTQNIVTINGQNALVTLNSKDRVEFVCPSYLNDHQVTLTLTSAGQSASKDGLTNAWVRLSKIPTGMYMHLPIEGRLFLLTYNMDLDASQLYEIDLANNDWMERSNPPFVYHGAFSFSLDGKAYVGGGFYPSTSENNNSLWEYNPEDNIWTELGPLPVEVQYPAAFSINNKGYFIQSRSEAGQNVNQLWEFDPGNNVWTRKADLPGFNADKGFTFQNEFYSYNHQTPEFWSVYNPISNQWRDIEILIDYSFSMGDFLFAIDDLLYFKENDGWDPYNTGVNAYSLNDKTWHYAGSYPMSLDIYQYFKFNSMYYFHQETVDGPYFWELDYNLFK